MVYPWWLGEDTQPNINNKNWNDTLKTCDYFSLLLKMSKNWLPIPTTDSHLKTKLHIFWIVHKIIIRQHCTISSIYIRSFVTFMTSFLSTIFVRYVTRVTSLVHGVISWIMSSHQSIIAYYCKYNEAESQDTPFTSLSLFFLVYFWHFFLL